MKYPIASLFAFPSPATLAACSAAALLAACGPNDGGAGTRTAARISADLAVATVHVATDGSDANPGTEAAPFQTIDRASAAAGPGTVVRVAPGTYAGNVRTRSSGTPLARISYVSDVRWAARIVGSGSEAMWTNDGDFVDISGFDISGPGRLGILNNASNTVVANNHIHDLTVSGGCTGSGGAGVVNAHYGGSNGTIIDNVVHDIGVPGACNRIQGIYSSNRGGQIMNNMVFRVSGFGIHLWHAAGGATIANNTVFANGSASVGGGIVIGNGDAGGARLTDTQVINNIVYDNPRAGIQEYCYAGQNCIGGGNVVANNLVRGSATPIAMRVGSPSGTIQADPQFVAYNPDGTGDYRLQGGSPAINRGLGAPAPATDILGVARPLGGGIDLGAFESH
jgi:parallel beta-helix repeat protein